MSRVYATKILPLWLVVARSSNDTLETKFISHSRGDRTPLTRFVELTIFLEATIEEDYLEAKIS